MPYRLLLASAVLCLCTAAIPNPPLTDQKTVETLEKQWLAGEHDRSALDTILAADFVHPVAAGVFLSKTQHINWAVTHPGPNDRQKLFDQLQVRVYGSAAVVTGMVISTDQKGSEEKTVFTDVFAKRGGRWQAVNAQENPVAR
ncbi:MAG TPA: nuclear transport factor 2 family protein [Gemmatimonadales bacterium]|nr:nuclear transport factor 2 family protein [Gemmatimonadales bacterium]